MTLWRFPPLRWLWRLRVARILMRLDWSFREAWRYSAGLAETLDQLGEEYLSPGEALGVDQSYWD